MIHIGVGCCGNWHHYLDRLPLNHHATDQVSKRGGWYEREVVAIDGKTIWRSFDHRREQSPLHGVSAWGSEQTLSPPEHFPFKGRSARFC